MNIYEHDGRVRVHADHGFTVRHHPYDRRVIFSVELKWCVYEGPGMAMLGCGHATADAAIRSLIGEPAVSA